MSSKLKAFFSCACCTTAIMAGASAASVPAVAQPAAATEQVIVTGTRAQGRTVENSPSPVDVLSSDDLTKAGQTDIFGGLNATLPSFEIPASGGDLSRLVRSARLRGLSPDETLVLVDGKRRHVSASINADVGPVGGSDPADLDLITPSMIDHIEVLRDGAAAIYGSDAVAGVINIITKKGTDGGSAYGQAGAFFPGKGFDSDGFSSAVGANYGIAVGSGGYVNASIDYRTHDHTNRCGQDPRTTGFGITGNVCLTAGDPASHTLTLGTSDGYDFGSATAYLVATYADRTSQGWNGWRKPNRYASPWYQTNYPRGFVPAEGIRENDYSVTGGIRSDGASPWNWDLSVTYGTDQIEVDNINDLNPTFVTNTGYTISPIPYRMRAGSYDDNELVVNLDVSRNLDTGLFATPVTLAFGGEYRRNGYKIGAGEFNSYTGAGATAFPGISPANATNVSRDNKAFYVDASTNIVEAWQVDIAGRYEHYSDVGDTLTGKVTTRYDFSPRFSIRGTASSGFRAPTLAQEFQTQLNVGPTSVSGQLPATSPAAVSLGAIPLKAEFTQNYTAGFTSEPLVGLHVAVDVYQINIHDQIANSGTIGAAVGTNPALYNTVVAALAQSGFTVSPAVTQAFAQFYTNGLGTRTKGVDVTADYQTEGPFDGAINWAFAANFNDVGLTKVSTFANGSTEFTPNVLSEITMNAPKNKMILSANYVVDAWDVTLRETRWGTSAEVMADQSLGPPTYYTNVITPKFTTDLQVGYKVTNDLKIAAGAVNLFNQYPNQTVFGTRNVDNAHVYSSSSPFGYNGGNYYIRLDYKF